MTKTDNTVQAQLHWCIALLIYGVALTTATHWPQLQLPGQIPATDKTLHLGAYGLLMVFLRGSIRTRPLWIAAAIALVWSILDELTQGIPGLNRTVALEDGIANAMGVSIATAMLFVWRPYNSAQDEAVDSVFARRMTWFAAIGALGACGLIVALCWATADLRTTRMAIMILAASLAAIGLPLLYVWLRQTQVETTDNSACASTTTRAFVVAGCCAIIGAGIVFVPAIGQTEMLWRPSTAIGVVKTMAPSFDLFVACMFLAASTEVTRRCLHGRNV